MNKEWKQWNERNEMACLADAVLYDKIGGEKCRWRDGRRGMVENRLEMDELGKWNLE